MSLSMKVAAIAMAAMMLAAAAGCNRVTRENYDRVVTGMTIEQVKEVLGQPGEVNSGGGEILGVGASATSMIWRTGTKSITVVFVNNQVVSKSMSNL